MPDLTIIIASTRPQRAGLPIATWVHERAREHSAFDVRLVDLAAVALPMLDEPHHPSLRDYVQPHTKSWSATIDAADAFVFVTPEYNHGYPAPLKNAIDYLHQEWAHKPVGFVSYGGLAAGTRAVQQLKQVVIAVGMLPVVEAVHIPFHTEFLRDGRLRPNEIIEHAASTLLDVLAAADAVLRPQRAVAQRAA